MYEKVGKQTISDFLLGYNGTIFAYGQSGSGKTFSMLGPEDVTNALAKDFNSIPEEITKSYGITPRTYASSGMTFTIANPAEVALYSKTPSYE